MSSDEMECRLKDLLGYEFSRQELLRLEALSFEIRPELIALAKRAKSRVPTGILTNNSPLLNEALPVHFPELLQSFDPILFSYQFGHVKPEKELFEAVRERLNVPSNSILFFDDTPGHVASASASGWDAFLYESPIQVMSVLKHRSIIVDAA